MKEETTLPTGDDEPVVHDEAAYQELFDEFALSKLRSWDNNLQEIANLGWTPARLVERTLDFFGVDLDEDLISEIKTYQQERAEAHTAEIDDSASAIRNITAVFARLIEENAAGKLSPEKRDLILELFGADLDRRPPVGTDAGV